LNRIGVKPRFVRGFFRVRNSRNPGLIFIDVLAFLRAGARSKVSLMADAVPNVLVVDDEAQIRRLLRASFELEGFCVSEAANGMEAIRAASTSTADLIILDLALPDFDGAEVLQQLRAWSRVPVIVLSVRSSEMEKVRLLELGADDYVVKPFSPRELVLRIRAIFRRRGSGKDDGERLKVGELILDCSRHEVKAANRRVECTATEFKLLRILMERHGRVQGRDRLLSDVWGYDSVIDTRTVDTHMRRLRDKLGDCARYIETVRGFGYRLAAPGR
jgi:DNA-binding response OmpR family regulator